MKEIDFRHDLLPLKDKIFRLALRITLRADEAEDITEETLVRAWEKRGELAQVNSLEAYCLTAARNLALDTIAKKEHQNLSLDEDAFDRPDASRSPQEELEHSEKLASVRQIINSLPEKQRTVVQLRDIEGLSYSEIAAVTGWTEEVVKVTLHRARKFIKLEYLKLEHHGLEIYRTTFGTLLGGGHHGRGGAHFARFLCSGHLAGTSRPL